jgi:hypothetical protein
VFLDRFLSPWGIVERRLLTGPVIMVRLPDFDNESASIFAKAANFGLATDLR